MILLLYCVVLREMRLYKGSSGLDRNNVLTSGPGLSTEF